MYIILHDGFALRSSSSDAPRWARWQNELKTAASSFDHLVQRLVHADSGKQCVTEGNMVLKLSRLTECLRLCLADGGAQNAFDANAMHSTQHCRIDCTDNCTPI